MKLFGEENSQVFHTFWGLVPQAHIQVLWWMECLLPHFTVLWRLASGHHRSRKHALLGDEMENFWLNTDDIRIWNQTPENEQFQVEINWPNLTMSAKNPHLLWKTAVTFAEPGGESGPVPSSSVFVEFAVSKLQCDSKLKTLLTKKHLHLLFQWHIAKQSQISPSKQNCRWIKILCVAEFERRILGKRNAKTFQNGPTLPSQWSCEMHT